MLTLPQVADKHLLIMTCGDGRGSVCVCVEDSTSIFTLFDIVECGSQQVGSYDCARGQSAGRITSRSFLSCRGVG